MERRKFLELAGVGLSSALVLRRLAAEGVIHPSTVNAEPATPASKPFGSGHFGDWFDDEFGLPAYRSTCDQITDPITVTPGAGESFLLDILSHRKLTLERVAPCKACAGVRVIELEEGLWA